jgi:hypothetical protein
MRRTTAPLMFIASGCRRPPTRSCRSHCGTVVVVPAPAGELRDVGRPRATGDVQRRIVGGLHVDAASNGGLDTATLIGIALGAAVLLWIERRRTRRD